VGGKGPARTPTKVLEMRGSSRAKSRKGEPEGPPGVPEPPKWLEGEARAEWDYLVPILETMRVLTRADRSALASLCEAWGEYRKCSDIVSAEGLTVVNARGNANRHPASVAQQEAWTRWFRLMERFGLTPAARAGMAISTSKPDENRGKTRFFGKGR